MKGGGAGTRLSPCEQAAQAGFRNRLGPRVDAEAPPPAHFWQVLEQAGSKRGLPPAHDWRNQELVGFCQATSIARVRLRGML